jgi:hypothetical protein
MGILRRSRAKDAGSYQGMALAQYFSLSVSDASCVVRAVRPVADPDYGEFGPTPLHSPPFPQTSARRHALLQNLIEDALVQLFPALRGE